MIDRIEVRHGARDQGHGFTGKLGRMGDRWIVGPGVAYPMQRGVGDRILHGLPAFLREDHVGQGIEPSGVKIPQNMRPGHRLDLEFHLAGLLHGLQQLGGEPHFQPCFVHERQRRRVVLHPDPDRSNCLRPARP